MNDFNLKVSVHNARLLRAIREDYQSVAEFCRVAQVDYARVVGLIGFKEKPVLKSGGWKPLARNVAAALGKYPEEIWPKYLEQAQVTKSSAEIEVSAEQVEAITSHDDDPMTAAFRRKMLAEWSKGLRPRELRAIALRQQGASLDDVAEEFGVSRPRAAQIEAKALRKMRVAAGREGVRGFTDAVNI